MELHVVINGRKDLAGQLYKQLRSAIESGRLAAGSQLPPSRLLAEQLGISRKTISDTYAQLTYENFLTGVIGKGTYVNARATKVERKQSPDELAGFEVIESWRKLPVFLRHPTLEGSLRYDFIGGATSKGQFPQDDWRRCTSHALRQIAGSKGFYSLPEGLPALRNAIAQHIAFSRGVNCRDEDVVVCNGAQQALDLISRVLTRPGSIVAMEDPGYPPARLLFGTHGATVMGVPVDAEGIVVEQIPRGTRLIYVTPSHQFPLGMPMSHERRVALLAKAHELGAIIIEDDYDSEFRYASRPIPALRELDREGRVIYVNTFSKSLAPGLRIGYLVLPDALMARYRERFSLYAATVSSFDQFTLAAFMHSGGFERHISRSRKVYQARRDALMAAIDREFTELPHEISRSEAGLHLLLHMRNGMLERELVERAKAAGVRVYALSAYYLPPVRPPRATLVLGYAGMTGEQIDEAAARLRRAWTKEM